MKSYGRSGLRAWWMGCMFAVVIAAPALGQQAGRDAPAAAVKVTTVAGITEYRLANGLRVLLLPDSSKPTTTVNVTYLVGSRHEGYGETGMAHLLEHLLFKGTPTNKDIPQQFAQRGARWNGTTSFDRTNYFEMFQASQENLRWAIELEADRMVNSNIAKSDLDSEMTVVRNEFERGENAPGGVLSKRLQSVAFDWHNYQNSPIGNRSDIENVAIENLRAFYRRYYQPDNAVVLVAGPFDVAKTLDLINASFGRIPKPTRVLPTLWTAEPTQDGERMFTVRRSGNIQLIMVGYKMPSVLHEDAAALSFATSILGNAPNGRLHKLLVESGQAVAVSAGTRSGIDPNLAVVAATMKEGEPLESVQAQLIETVESFHATPPTDEEMNRVRLQRERAYEQTLSSPESLAITLSEAIASGDWRLYFLSQERDKSVTSEDVMRVAKKYFVRDNRTVGRFIPTSEPDRAEIPEAPTLVQVFKDFKPPEALAAGEDFEATPEAIDARTQRHTLPNGMKVALLPKKTRGETVNVVLRSHNGDEQSRFGRSAAIGLANQMITRGSTRFTRAQLADEFSRLKISGGVGLGSATLQTKREHLVAALELTAHLVREPTFPESEFEQLRKQMFAGLESNKSDPGALSAEALGKHFNAYRRGDPRYYESTDERIEDVSAVTLDMVKQAHRDFTGFSNAEVAIVGDFDAAEVLAALERLFGRWNSPLTYKRIENPYQDVAAANRTIETPDKENAVFRVQMLLELGEDDPEYPALALADNIFGGSGLNSRLAKRIRGQEGLSYGVGTSLSISDLDRRGVFSASATAAPQNVARLEEVFFEELERALRDGFTQRDLENAKSGVLTSRKQRRAQDRAVASSWTSYLYRDETFLESAKMDAKFAAVTLDEVNAAFRRYIDPKRLTVVKAGDFAKAAGSAAATSAR